MFVSELNQILFDQNALIESADVRVLQRLQIIAQKAVKQRNTGNHGKNILQCRLHTHSEVFKKRGRLLTQFSVTIKYGEENEYQNEENIAENTKIFGIIDLHHFPGNNSCCEPHTGHDPWQFVHA
jgi:hypothetical protein